MNEINDTIVDELLESGVLTKNTDERGAIVLCLEHTQASVLARIIASHPGLATLVVANDFERTAPRDVIELHARDLPLEPFCEYQSTFRKPGKGEKKRNKKDRWK